MQLDTFILPEGRHGLTSVTLCTAMNTNIYALYKTKPITTYNTRCVGGFSSSYLLCGFMYVCCYSFITLKLASSKVKPFVAGTFGIISSHLNFSVHILLIIVSMAL